MTILASLSHNNKGKKIASCITRLFLAGSIFFGSGFGYSVIENKNLSNRPTRVLKRLIEKDPQLARDYIKDNPKEVDKLQDEYSALNWLEKTFLPESPISPNKNLEAKVSVDNKNKISFNGKNYFSSFDISDKAVYINDLNMIFDPVNNYLCKFNGSILEKTISNVDNVVSSPEGTYFSQGNSVYRTNEEKQGDFDSVYTSPPASIKLKEVKGTNLAVAFSDNFPVVFRTHENRNQAKRLEGYLTIFKHEVNLDMDDKTKLVYKKDRLYISNEDNIYVVNPDLSISRFKTPIFTDFIDYFVKYVDSDKKEDLIIIRDDNLIRVNRDDGVEYDISIPDDFKFNPDYSNKWLSPEHLKYEVKKTITQIKNEK